jgi:hypothetical protein
MLHYKMKISALQIHMHKYDEGQSAWLTLFAVHKIFVSENPAQSLAWQGFGNFRSDDI